MTMAMPHMQTWGVMDLVLLCIMWSVMMVAMMVPSATPMLLMYTTINRRRREQQQPYVPTAVFLGGYLLVWSGFSILATLAQWGLHSAALLSPMMREYQSASWGAWCCWRQASFSGRLSSILAWRAAARLWGF